MRTAILLILIAFALSAQDTLTIFDLPDIAGTGAAVHLASSGTARWCQIIAPAANVSDVRWGGSTISASRGATIAPGAGQFIPPAPPAGTAANSAPSGRAIVNLASTYVLVASGDVAHVTCAR